MQRGIYTEFNVKDAMCTVAICIGKFMSCFSITQYLYSILIISILYKEFT